MLQLGELGFDKPVSLSWRLSPPLSQLLQQQPQIRGRPVGLIPLDVPTNASWFPPLGVSEGLAGVDCNDMAAGIRARIEAQQLPQAELKANLAVLIGRRCRCVLLLWCHSCGTALPAAVVAAVAWCSTVPMPHASELAAARQAHIPVCWAGVDCAISMNPPVKAVVAPCRVVYAAAGPFLTAPVRCCLLVQVHAPAAVPAARGGS